MSFLATVNLVEYPSRTSWGAYPNTSGATGDVTCSAGFVFSARPPWSCGFPGGLREAVRIIEHGGSLSDVTYYAVLIIAAAVVQGFVRTYSRALIFNAGRDVEYDLRNDLFAHLEKLPLSYYHKQRTGDLMSRVINDISAVRVMLGPGVLNFVNAPLYYVYAMALMLSMDVRMTLAAVGAVSVVDLRRAPVSRPDHEKLPRSAATDVGSQQPCAGKFKRHACRESLRAGGFPNPAVYRFE